MSVLPKHSGIQSLEIGVDVFKQLHEMGRPVALHELASAVSMHRAKLHRYLVSLVRAGLVAQNADRRYCAGPYALRLMGGESRIARLREAALSAMPQLARDIGETVFLSCWRSGRAVIVQFEEPIKPISIRPSIGGVLPLLNSSPGRAFAAFLPSAETEALVNQELEAVVPSGKRALRLTAYRRELADVRRRRVARSLAERFPGVYSMSAPILDEDGKAVLVITAFGLQESFDASWNGSIAHALRGWAGAHSASKA